MEFDHMLLDNNNCTYYSNKLDLSQFQNKLYGSHKVNDKIRYHQLDSREKEGKRKYKRRW